MKKNGKVNKENNENKENKKNKEKENKKGVTLAVPEEIYNFIRELAEKEDRNISKQVISVLRKAYEVDKLKAEEEEKKRLESLEPAEFIVLK